MITATQIRMARAGLRWTTQDLADQAKIGVSTVNRIENGSGSNTATLMAMQRAFERKGVCFSVDGQINLVGVPS